MIRKGNRKRNKQIKSEAEVFSKEVRSKMLSFLKENKNEISLDVQLNKVTKQMRLEIFCGAHVTEADLTRWKISNILEFIDLVTIGKKNISDDEIIYKVGQIMNMDATVIE